MDTEHGHDDNDHSFHEAALAYDSVVAFAAPLPLPARQFAAAEFKAKCLEVMDEVARTGRPVVVTKRGRPVVRLIAEAHETVDLTGSVTEESLDWWKPQGGRLSRYEG